MRSGLRRLWSGLVQTAVGLGLVIAAVAFSLLATPAQSETAAGQLFWVGAARPNLNWSGPGELVLNHSPISTVQQFPGLIRPRIEVRNLDVAKLQAELSTPDKREQAGKIFGQALVRGWVRYFAWQLVVAAAVGAILFVTVYGRWRGWQGKRLLVAVALGALAVVVVNLASVAVTAYRSAQVLGRVKSVDDLVGRSPVVVTPEPAVPKLPGVQVVVLGDSTASGAGNLPVDDPSEADLACSRSRDSYPAVLVRNGLEVLNQACSGATVRAGILGPQTAGGLVVPPQLGVAKQATSAKVIIVSIGANDVGWTPLVGFCARSRFCDDKLSTTYYEGSDGSLERFKKDYYELLRQIAELPQRPKVLVNLYYDPFGEGDVSCLESTGATREKVEVMRARLQSLNRALAEIATAFGFTPVQPRFEGHEVCSRQPFVQRPGENSPLHPNAAGGVAIALADQRALTALLLSPTPSP